MSVSPTLYVTYLKPFYTLIYRLNNMVCIDNVIYGRILLRFVFPMNKMKKNAPPVSLAQQNRQLPPSITI